MLILGYISVRIPVPIPTVAPSKDALNRMFRNSCCINITYGGIRIWEKKPKNVWQKDEIERKAEEGNLRVAKDQLKLLLVGNVIKNRMFSLIRISKAQFKPILSLIQIQILSVEQDLMKELLRKHSKPINNIAWKFVTFL